MGNKFKVEVKFIFRDMFKLLLLLLLDPGLLNLLVVNCVFETVYIYIFLWFIALTTA